MSEHVRSDWGDCEVCNYEGWPCHASQIAALEAERDALAVACAEATAPHKTGLIWDEANDQVASVICQHPRCGTTDPAARGAAILAAAQAALTWARDREYLAPDYSDEDDGDDLWGEMLAALRALNAQGGAS